MSKLTQDKMEKTRWWLSIHTGLARFNRNYQIYSPIPTLDKMAMEHLEAVINGLKGEVASVRENCSRLIAENEKLKGNGDMPEHLRRLEPRDICFLVSSKEVKIILEKLIDSGDLKKVPNIRILEDSDLCYLIGSKNVEDIFDELLGLVHLRKTSYIRILEEGERVPLDLPKDCAIVDFRGFGF